MARANEANYLRMQEALAHLEQNAPCEIVQKGSSEFYHGDRDRVSTHCDRFLLKVNRYMSQPVFCRVVFDSNDYGMPPDILMDTTRILPENQVSPEAYLPHAWDINDRRCLTLWMQHIHALLNGAPSPFHTREYYAWEALPSAPTQTELLTDTGSNATELPSETGVIEQKTDVSSSSSFAGHSHSPYMLPFQKDSPFASPRDSPRSNPF